MTKFVEAGIAGRTRDRLLPPNDARLSPRLRISASPRLPVSVSPRLPLSRPRLPVDTSSPVFGSMPRCLSQWSRTRFASASVSCRSLRMSSIGRPSAASTNTPRKRNAARARGSTASRVSGGSLGMAGNMLVLHSGRVFSKINRHPASGRKPGRCRGCRALRTGRRRELCFDNLFRTGFCLPRHAPWATIGSCLALFEPLQAAIATMRSTAATNGRAFFTMPMTATPSWRRCVLAAPASPCGSLVFV